VTGVLPEHSVPPGKVFWNYSRFSRFGKDEQATPTLFAVDSYDKNENWYTGTGTPASNQYDVWSVITHEFGHALGLRDTQSIYCPGNATDATMCGQIFRGTTWFRSLEADDQNGALCLYPR
jgi:hypothetical protein